eukprot:TRINITY_DN8482_c0_g1_i1.p1 TRINITY_DN8482_c0_g1~~TRINITY_DN8482_c0_g1_i1.p1  ORF type:complete len:298 (+),score=43.21 TRINITY_DN8482_c0_g1_i1:70-963(+)
MFLFALASCMIMWGVNSNPLGNEDVSVDHTCSLLQHKLVGYAANGETSELDKKASTASEHGEVSLPVICRNRSEAEWYAVSPVLPTHGCTELSAAERAAPLVNAHMESDQDRSCLLFTSCALAHERNNLAIWSRTVASSYAAVTGESQTPWDYDDGLLKMPAGSWLGDAEYCLVSGFFDIPNPRELLQNEKVLKQHVEQTCRSIPDDLKQAVSMDSLVASWARMNNGATAQAALPSGPNSQKPFINASEAQLHNAAYCATGAMDCMLYWCLDYYCKLPDGRVGSGCQCNPDFYFGMP